MKQKNQVARMCAIALLGALCFVGFMYLRIDIPVGGEKTAIHFGNVFCVLAALLLGGWQGGLAGAIGMGMADLLSGYADSFPKTFLLKLLIGLIVGFVAHTIAHVNDHRDDPKYLSKWTFLAAFAGMLFNVFADPIVGFFYKNYILGITYEAAKILAAWSAVSTLINAVTSVVLATLLYRALAPKLKHLASFR